MQTTGWPPALGDPRRFAPPDRRARRRRSPGRRRCAEGPSPSSGWPACSRARACSSTGSRRASPTSPASFVDRAYVALAALDRGFVLSSAQVAVLAESDLTGRRRPHRVPRARARAVEGFFDDLAPGSYVVHHVHGVARYGGMVTRSISGAERDYLLLEYRGDDRLYVPSDQIDTVTPYSGGEHPTLSRLNGGEWQRQRSRVRQAVREIAQELVVLYQRRLASPGHAFAPDTPWQAEMEQAFPFPETTDQLRAIVDVKADMERETPMDRLVCGDVGFGKTEVAIRAVFKAVQDGKQAAILVPTTLLAQQHFQTLFRPASALIRCASRSCRVLTPAERGRSRRRASPRTAPSTWSSGTHRACWAEDVVFRRPRSAARR